MKENNIFKKIKKRIDINLIFDILLFIYLTLNLIHYIFAFEGLMQIAIILSMSGIGLLMFAVVVVEQKEWRIIIFTLLMLLFGGISTVFNNNTSLFVYLTMFRYLGIASYLIYYKQDKKIMTLMIVITLLMFSPVLFMNLGFNLLSKASRNSYSILLIIATLIYNKSFWDRKEKAPMFPTIASLFITIFSGGRSGIITLSVYTAGVLYNNFIIMKKTLFKERDDEKFVENLEDTIEIPIIDEKRLEEYEEKGFVNQSIKFLKSYKYEILKLFGIVAIFLAIFAFKTLDTKYEITAMLEEKIEDNITDTSYGFKEKGLSSKSRVKIIEKYFGYIFTDINAFLNGVKLKNEPLFEKFSYNLHNSYLQLHSKFGIYGIILCGYLCFRALINMVRNKKWGDVMLYLAILARVFTDNAAFPRHMDIIIFYFVFKYYDISTKQDPSSVKNYDVLVYLQDKFKNKKQSKTTNKMISKS